jgi:hypothetical protein
MITYKDLYRVAFWLVLIQFNIMDFYSDRPGAHSFSDYVNLFIIFLGVVVLIANGNRKRVVKRAVKTKVSTPEA